MDVGLWTKTLSRASKETFSVPVLVRNRTGYQNLCRLITLMKLRVPKHAKPGECAVTPDELAEHAEGLICLTGGDDGPLAKAFHRRDAESAEEAQRISRMVGRDVSAKEMFMPSCSAILIGMKKHAIRQ